MNILQHVKAFGTAFGGVERVVEDLVPALNTRRDLACDVLCQSRVTAHQRFEAYSVFTAATDVSVSSASLSWDDYRLWRRLAPSYDIVHTHLPWPQSNINYLLSRPRGRLVVHWHSDIVRQRFLYPLFRPMESWLLRHADVICVTSPKLLQESTALTPFQDKCISIPIGISDLTYSQHETERAAALRAKYAGRVLVFSLGRLVPYKGFTHLIAAAKTLPDSYCVLIAGAGPDHTSLQAQIDELDLSERVNLLGRISSSEALAHMNACDVFCLPSIHKSEAFGIVQLEAMRAGKPIVSTCLSGSGVDWVNQDGITGRTVAPGNAEALSDAISSLTTAERVRLGHGARKRYEANFTLDRMVTAVEELYRRIA